MVTTDIYTIQCMSYIVYDGGDVGDSGGGGSGVGLKIRNRDSN